MATPTTDTRTKPHGTAERLSEATLLRFSRFSRFNRFGEPNVSPTTA